VEVVDAGMIVVVDDKDAANNPRQMNQHNP
jgi:hypothetical protein